MYMETDTKVQLMHMSIEDLEVEHVTFIEAVVQAANVCKAPNR